MTKNLCYKIVERRFGALTSCVVCDEAEVVYSIGVEATAPDWLAELGYHLLAFATLEDAVRYVSGHNTASTVHSRFRDGEYIILECEFTDEIEALPPMLYVPAIKEGIITESDNDWPYATHMYRSLTPVRVVTYDEAMRQSLRSRYND